MPGKRKTNPSRSETYHPLTTAVLITPAKKRRRTEPSEESTIEHDLTLAPDSGSPAKSFQFNPHAHIRGLARSPEVELLFKRRRVGNIRRNPLGEKPPVTLIKPVVLYPDHEVTLSDDDEATYCSPEVLERNKKRLRRKKQVRKKQDIEIPTGRFLRKKEKK